MTQGLADRRDAGRRGAPVRRAVSVLARIVRLVATLLATVLVVDIVLTVASANPDNPITVFFRGAAGALTLGFSDLFVLDDPRLTVLVNHGIAAVVWLVIGAIVARLLLAAVGRR